MRHRLGLLALFVAVALLGCQVAPHPDEVQALDSAVIGALDPFVTQTQYKGGGAVAPGVEIQKPDLWRDIRSGFVLDRHQDQRSVQQELRWLERHPNYLIRMQPRLARHLAYIHQRVRARGLPSELALLPIVESALDPYAFSHGGAAGLWQFIPATATRFGLDRNWWYDGRRDPVAATDAALDYLERLHDRFDDWYLALAGYNAGEGNVMRALRKAPPGSRFFELDLPRETSAYVPRLLALAELVADPERLGVTLPTLDPEIPFVVVDTGSQMDLTVASNATGIDLKTLYAWNPALSQWSTPPKGPHYLVLPKDRARDASAQLARVPAERRVQWLRVKVRPGDTLSQLAHRHRTDVASLRQANRLRGNRIRVGQPLLIPKSPEALANTVASRTPGATYVVRSGDSLWTISREHDVSMQALMKTNHVGPKDFLRVGQKLTLPVGSHQGTFTREAQIRKVRYGVRKGDSLARIAGKFRVQVKDIVSWNQLNARDYLQPGQTLLLYVDASTGGE